MITTTDGDEAAPAESRVIPDPEAVALAIGDLENQRKWIAAIRLLTESRFNKPFDNANVQIAYEDMLLAAYERLERILNSDLPYRPRGANARQS